MKPSLRPASIQGAKPVHFAGPPVRTVDNCACWLDAFEVRQGSASRPGSAHREPSLPSNPLSPVLPLTCWLAPPARRTLTRWFQTNSPASLPTCHVPEADALSPNRFKPGLCRRNWLLNLPRTRTPASYQV